MSRRTIERVALAFGVVVLGFVLASATFVDRRPPGVARMSVSSTASDGRTALTHATVDVEFTEPVDQQSVESRFRITPTVPGALSWAGDRVLVFTPSRKLPVATEFAVHFEPGFRDRIGNASTIEVPPFSFRTVDLPQVLAETVPLDGAVGVGLDTPLSLTFDRLMDTELTAGAIRTEPAASLAPSWRGATLVLTPMEPLASGTAYRLTIGQEAADVDGNGLSLPFSLRFSTVSTGLRVETLTPADGSAGAAPLSPIAIVFDRPIDPGSVAGALTITPPVEGRLDVVGLPRDAPPTAPPEPVEPGATAPAASATPVSAPLIGPARVLVFTPSAPLAGHTTFTVRLRPGAVRALDASQVADGQDWTFTTGSTPDRLQNQIVFISPRTGVTNVWAMNPDGTNARQLTAELTPVTSYDVGIDGLTLVYATAGAVKRMALPGGVTTVPTRPEHAEYAPRLHPAGGSVLVARRDRATGRDAGLWLVPLVDGAPAELQVMKPGSTRTGSVAPPLGSADAGINAYEPDGRAGPWATASAFSSDGASLLVVCASGDVVRLDVLTGAGSSLALREPIGPPVWAPAHDAFAIAAVGPGGRSGTWHVGRTGLPVAGPELAAWPSATATGALVGISAAEPGRVAYQPPLGPLTVLTLAPELLDRQPVFSPAGDAILFVRVAEDEPTRSAGIWLMAPDGRELRQLSPGGSDPRWLP